MSNSVLSERLEGSCNLGLITLNRVNKLNALNGEMIKDITDILLAWKNDNEIDAVIINSSCDRAFCAGGDIRGVYDNGINNVDKSTQFFQQEYALNHLIFNYPKPYIALLNGISMGGGLGISLHGSFVIAREDLKLAMPESKIGFFPDIGGTYFLSRIADNLGMYMALTGDPIDANTAQHYDLIDCVLDNDSFDNAIETLLECNTLELNNLNNVFTKSETNYTNSAFKPSADFIHACSAKNFKQFNRDLNDTKIKTILEARSPLSLIISYAAIMKGKQLPFENCMFNEYFLTQEFIRDTEFYEGIRALIVEKTSPMWTYSLDDVTPEVVESYFSQDNKKRFEFYD